MIPLVDLKAQYSSISDELNRAVLDTLASGEYILGSRVKEFERVFAEYAATREVVAVNSGTSALHLALLAAGVGPGDEVITVPMTFIATASAIAYVGAHPVFVDVDPESWVMDAARVEAAITPRTRAIIPVHLHGRMADMTQIADIARKNGLVVIEDAAQSHGAEHDGARAGTLGDMACFSFYAGKNLGACGEGGAVATNNPDYADHIRLLRDWGAKEKYNHVVMGYNYRMEGLQGAILSVKLRHLEAWTEQRIAAAQRYRTALADVRVGLPAPVQSFVRHVYHIFAVRVSDRDRIAQLMRETGVGVGAHYPIPVHLQPAFAYLGHKPGDFPVTEAIASETLSLPLFPEISEAQIGEVAEKLIKACGETSSKAAQ